MKIVVCVRQGLDGEINPFDASAYEAALSVKGGEVILLSMGAPKTREMLLSLTRLGASRAVLLSDPAFAGADTLATAYTLSLAIKRLSPELVICGRQTLIGDTAQTPPMLAQLISYPMVTEVMSLAADGEGIACVTRASELHASLPALITVERSLTLRFPRLGSKLAPVEVWSAQSIGADPQRCGLKGSPTRVISTLENRSGRRKCKFIKRSELDAVIAECLEKSKQKVTKTQKKSTERLKNVIIVGEKPRSYAECVSDNIHVAHSLDAELVSDMISTLSPDAVLFASDADSKRIAAIVAARLSLGLCADCTSLDVKDGCMIMYRPALAGSLIAEIKSLTRPAMATVRTEESGARDITVGAGFGIRASLPKARKLAEDLGAELAVSRKLVDNGYAPYSEQVGLTGKTVCPSVYVALGISGAVHHIAGIDRSGFIIAVNPDKSAPIFDYADFGIVDEF